MHSKQAQVGLFYAKLRGQLLIFVFNYTTIRLFFSLWIDTRLTMPPLGYGFFLKRDEIYVQPSLKLAYQYED